MFDRLPFGFKDIPRRYQKVLRENLRRLVARSKRRVFQQIEDLEFVEWIEKHRILPSESAEKGRMRMSRTPYLVGIAEALASRDPRCKVVVVRKGAQLGMSELAVSLIGWIIHQMPVPILFLSETLDKAKKVVKSRIAPMLKTKTFSGVIRAEDVFQNNIAYPGGSLTVAGSNSPSSYSSSSAPVIVLDEFARYPPSIANEGDPISLALARTITFGDRGKVYVPSTPVEVGIEEGNFNAAYESGDCREYMMPCPHCGEFIRFHKGNFEIPREGSPFIRCDGCEGEIHEHHKAEMLPKGIWKATKEADNPEVVSFNVPGLLSPPGWLGWDQIADAWRAAVAGKRSKRPVYNLMFGIPYSEEIEMPDKFALANHIHEREVGVVPDGVAFVTMGVDVQRGWCSWSVWGWGTGERGWWIAQGRTKGDLTTEAGAESLREAIGRSWYRADGREFAPTVVCIDSGEGEKTPIVYRFCALYPQPIPRKGGFVLQSSRTVVPIKGASKGDPDKLLARWSSVHRKHGVDRRMYLWMLQTAYGKKQLYEALGKDRGAFEKGDFGTVNLPAPIPQKVMRELFAEPVIPRRQKNGKMLTTFGAPEGGRSEKLDEYVYALAAAHIAGLPQMQDFQLERMANESGKKRVETPIEEGKGSKTTPKRRKKPGFFSPGVESVPLS